MSEFGESLKNLVMKGIEVIGNKANDLASSTKLKVGEFNLENEQKDLFSAIGSKVFELYSQGVGFPKELEDELKKAEEISKELRQIRAEKEKTEEKDQDERNERSADTDQPEVEPADTVPAAAAVYTAKDNEDVPVLKVEESDESEDGDYEDCPLSSAINDLFENMPPVEKMVDKVNSSLDELSDSLRKFSGEFGKQLDEFTDQMMGKDDNDPDDRT